MKWERELAKRCEIELEEIERLQRKGEDIQGWENSDGARDDWRNGSRDLFLLVIMFPNEFSLLRCLERECRKSDDLLEIDDTGGSAMKSPNHPTNDAAVSDTYDLSYFRQDHYRWFVRYKAWLKNLYATQTSSEVKERLVGVTWDFALLDYLQEALKESIELWNEWGAGSIDIVDGIKARIEALLVLERCQPDRISPPSIKALREEIREKESLKSQEHSTLRRRKGIHIGFADDSDVDDVPSEETKKGRYPSSRRREQSQAGQNSAFPTPLEDPSLLPDNHKDRMDPENSARRLLQSSNLFTVIAVGAFISSTGLVSVSITANKPVWAGFAQMVLYVFQAYAALESRIKTRKPKSEEDEDRFYNLRRTSTFFCIVITAGALAATVAAVIYPHYPLVSTGVSFGANLCQVVGTISVSNAIGV